MVKAIFALKNLHGQQRLVYGMLFLASVVISVHLIVLGLREFWGGFYTHYNNYVIFKSSFLNLINSENLYVQHKGQYADLYKYSPTFALFMGLFFALPDVLGLTLWNTLNIFVLYYSLTRLKTINTRKSSVFVLLFILFELIITTQNAQSNALLAGLTVLSYVEFERGRNALATLFIVMGIFVKLFSVLGCLLILIYPNRMKSLGYFLVWMFMFFSIPALVVGFQELLQQYINWFFMLKADHGHSFGMSLFTYLPLDPNTFSIKNLTLLISLILLSLPLLRWRKFSDPFVRLKFLSLLLIGMAVLNYKSESPTFIIAMTGIGIWFLAIDSSLLKTVLSCMALLFTSLWFTDLVPRFMKTHFIESVYLKPLFPSIIFLVLLIDLLFDRKEASKVQQAKG